MKNRYISKRYWEDKSTAMGQSDEMAKSFNDVINLSLGDPDLITDSRIIEAAFADAKAGHTRYTDFRGDPQLREEIAKFYQEEYDMKILDEEIFVNIRGTGMSSDEVTALFLEKAHVLVLPGNAFGRCGEGYVRIACTVGIEKLGEAFDRITEVLTRKENA